MAETVDTGDDGGRALLPLGVRRVVFGIVSVLVVFALYLLAVNGPALLYDLAHAAVMFCL
jgi:hypothetical protein